MGSSTCPHTTPGLTSSPFIRSSLVWEEQMQIRALANVISEVAGIATVTTTTYRNGCRSLVIMNYLMFNQTFWRQSATPISYVAWILQNEQDIIITSNASLHVYKIHIPTIYMAYPCRIYTISGHHGLRSPTLWQHRSMLIIGYAITEILTATISNVTRMADSNTVWTFYSKPYKVSPRSM